MHDVAPNRTAGFGSFAAAGGGRGGAVGSQYMQPLLEVAATGLVGCGDA